MTRRFGSRGVLGALALVLGAGIVATPAEAAARPLSEKMTERVVTTAVDESLASLERPENQRRLGAIIGSPELREGLQKLSASIVEGVVDGMVASSKRNGLGVDGKQTRSFIEKQIAPATATVVHRVVDAALDAALSEENAQKAARFGEVATRGVIRGLATGLEEDLGPALTRTMGRDLGPAIGNMLGVHVLPAVGRGLGSAPMQSAIGRTTGAIASNIVHGADDAIAEVQAEDGQPDSKGTLSVFGDNIALGYAVAVFFAFAFAALLIVMTVFLVRNNRRQRELERQGRTREQVMLDLLDQLGRDHPTMKTDLEALIRDQLRPEAEPK